MSKKHRIVNVRDFGAKGDGVTDDTAAIQAAFDALGGNATDEADDLTTPYVPSDADEPSELEVQQLLESRDAERAAAETVAAVVPVACTRCGGSGHEPEGASLPEPVHGPHALDTAPLNSKVVVAMLAGKPRAVLATHEGAHDLPAGDVAHRLPEGARITKTAEGRFVATQMSPVVDYPDLICTSAGEAIARFVGHFHR